MTKNPLVTVVIPSYNHQAYVAQSIQSVFSQTYKEVELIVIDDLRDTTSEDVGWCRKVKAAGYRIMLDPSVKVGHQKTVTI